MSDAPLKIIRWREVRDQFVTEFECPGALLWSIEPADGEVLCLVGYGVGGALSSVLAFYSDEAFK